MPDGSTFVLQLPPIPPPESAMLPGMAAPTPRDAPHGPLGPALQDMPDTSIGAVALQNPGSWTYDFDPATGVARAAFVGETTGPTLAPGSSNVQFATTAFVAAAVAGGVSSWNTRTGAVVLTLGDLNTLGVFGNVGRNLANNGAMNIAQRGAGPFTALGTYTLDRYVPQGSLDTISYTQVALLDADRTAIADEDFTYALQNVFVGNAGAGAFNALTMRIENARKFAAKNVTVSFYAKALAGAPRIGMSIDQNFGVGGSAQVNGAGTSVAITTAFARYQITRSVATEAGKAFGTPGTDYSAVNLWFSSGTTNAARSGTVGVQSGTIAITGLQVEVGTTMTSFEKADPATDLLRCQRTYQVGNTRLTGYAAAGVQLVANSPLAAPMRAVPTVAPNFSTQTNATGSTLVPADNQTLNLVSGAATATGAVVLLASFTASAEL